MKDLRIKFVKSAEDAFRQFNTKSRELLLDLTVSLGTYNVIALATTIGRNEISEILKTAGDELFLGFTINLAHLLTSDQDIVLKNIPTINKYIDNITDKSAYVSPTFLDYVSVKDDSLQGKIIMLMILHNSDIVTKFRALLNADKTKHTKAYEAYSGSI